MAKVIENRDTHQALPLRSRSAARRDRGLSASLRAQHQTGSWGGQHGDGHVPGCIHPRVGAYARLCEESAAAVRRQPSAKRRGADLRIGDRIS